jgi:hypothetical protein
VAKRSRTAQGVLAERALLTEMGVLSDPVARTMVSPPWAAVDLDPEELIEGVLQAGPHPDEDDDE